VQIIGSFAMNDKVKEVKLPSSGNMPEVGTPAVVSGWGKVRVMFMFNFSFT
jgi:hypothetical protein